MNYALLAALTDMDDSPERLAVAALDPHGNAGLTAEELHYKDPTKYPKPGAAVVAAPPAVSVTEQVPAALLPQQPSIAASKNNTRDELAAMQAKFEAEEPIDTAVDIKDEETEVVTPDQGPPARKGKENAHDRYYNNTTASFDQMAEVKGEWAVLAELSAWATKQAVVFKGTALSAYYRSLAKQSQAQSTAFMAAFAKTGDKAADKAPRFKRLFQASAENATDYQGNDMSLINEPPTANTPSEGQELPEPTAVDHGPFTLTYKSSGDYVISEDGEEKFDGTYSQAMSEEYNAMRPEIRMTQLREDLAEWAGE